MTDGMPTPPDGQAPACVACGKEKFTKLSSFRDAAGWGTFPMRNGRLVALNALASRGASFESMEEIAQNSS